MAVQVKEYVLQAPMRQQIMASEVASQEIGLSYSGHLPHSKCGIVAIGEEE